MLDYKTIRRQIKRRLEKVIKSLIDHYFPNKDLSVTIRVITNPHKPYCAITKYDLQTQKTTFEFNLYWQFEFKTQHWFTEEKERYLLPHERFHDYIYEETPPRLDMFTYLVAHEFSHLYDAIHYHRMKHDNRFFSIVLMVLKHIVKHPKLYSLCKQASYLLHTYYEHLI